MKFKTGDQVDLTQTWDKEHPSQPFGVCEVLRVMEGKDLCESGTLLKLRSEHNGKTADFCSSWVH